MAESQGQTVYYFGYGSNLWREQMSQRCPSSPYIGIARLRGWKWIINERGYANVVESPSSSASGPSAPSLSAEGGKKGENEGGGDDDDEVWGLVYCLSKHDEAQLDLNEGVPEAYEKETLEIEVWISSGQQQPVETGKEVGLSTQGAVSDGPSPPSEKLSGLVYVDRKRTTPGAPKKEYIFRMNKGIKDALREGIPVSYVDSVLRKFIPDMEDRTVEEFARKQALLFEDEQ